MLLLIAVVMSIKIGGMDFFVKFSTVLVMMTLLPIFFYFGFGLRKLTWVDIDTFSGDYACNTTIFPNGTKLAEVCSHEVPPIPSPLPNPHSFALTQPPKFAQP